MDDKQIDDLVKMLDSGMANGVGHVNVDTNAGEQSTNVQTMGCTDCSRTPLACSVPTLHEGLDDYKSKTPLQATGYQSCSAAEQRGI